MTLRAILWDMDGTLLDSEPAHEAAFHDALTELGVTVPDGFHDKLLGAAEDRVHAALCDATALTLSLHAWRACKWHHYRRHADAIRLRTSVAEQALRCARAGIPMAVVSNSTADEVALCLTGSKLAEHFPITVSRADVAHGKPAPDGYLRAASSLGIAAADCLVIEDSPTGCAAGHAAGMHVLYHPQTVTAKAPDGADYLPPEGDLGRYLDMRIPELRTCPLI